MSTFSLRSQTHRSPVLFWGSLWPLGALLGMTGAPARAQQTTSLVANASAAPQLTLEARPASSIAAPLRPRFLLSRLNQRRPLLLAFPAADARTAPQVIFSGAASNKTVNPLVSPNRSSSSSTPQPSISVTKSVAVATKTRFEASRTSAEDLGPVAASIVDNSATGANSATSFPMAPAPVSPGAALPVPSKPVASKANASPTSRDRMAQLSSRGGLDPYRLPAPVSSAPPQIGAISDAQRLLLAQLDADLGRAQRRLDRADTRLTEGQRQLSSVTGLLRTAMFDTGDDGRGLHPFVRVAQRYLGTPYVWGGESARGFDCSGFIMRVMRDLGYRALPHSAAEQFRYGAPVAQGLLKPGDLVFFANTYKPGVSHVGIYLGRGRFINAANSQVGTIVSSLSEPKWSAHYAGARRLLPVKS